MALRGRKSDRSSPQPTTSMSTPRTSPASRPIGAERGGCRTSSDIRTWADLTVVPPASTASHALACWPAAPSGNPSNRPSTARFRLGDTRSRPAMRVTAYRSAADETRRQPAFHLVERDPLLGHRVAFADRHRLVLERVEVDRHAVGRADLVVPAVPLADR